MIASGTAAYLSFRVGSRLAALPLSIVREIVQAPQITPVPGSDEEVAGVTLHSGIAVPVYDLARHAPLWTRPGPTSGSEDPGTTRQLVVCRVGEVLVGLLAERADLLQARLEEGERLPDEQDMRIEFLRGHLRSTDEAVALLEPAKLFASLGVPEGGGLPEGGGR